MTRLAAAANRHRSVTAIRPPASYAASTPSSEDVHADHQEEVATRTGGRVTTCTVPAMVIRSLVSPGNGGGSGLPADDVGEDPHRALRVRRLLVLPDHQRLATDLPRLLLGLGQNISASRGGWTFRR
jgi:hypothetical protein